MSRRVRTSSRPPRPARLPPWLRLTAVGLLLLAVGFGFETWARAQGTPAADAPRMEFDVEGLDCPVWCAVRLTESIDPLDGAVVERLDQHNGKVVVRYDPARQDVEQLRRLLDARGFPVVSARILALQPHEETPR